MLTRNLQLAIVKRLFSYTPQSVNKPYIKPSDKIDKVDKVDKVNNDTTTYNARRKLVYKIPDTLKSLSALPKIPSNSNNEPNSLNIDLKESEITSAVIGANNDIIRYAISEGIHTGLRQRQEYVSPVYEDDNLNKDDDNKPMSDAAAQKLFDEIMQSPDSPFAYHFRLAFEEELKRRYPDLDDKKLRLVRFEQEVRARWWFFNESRTKKFSSTVQKYCYTNNSDIASHTIDMVGKYFSVPETFYNHFWKAPPKPAIAKFDPYAEIMFQEDVHYNVLRNFHHSYDENEFKLNRDRRLLIREDAVKLVNVLKVIKNLKWADLPAASAPAGLEVLLDGSETSNPVVDSQYDPVSNLLATIEGLHSRSAGEKLVESQRIDMANAPGDLKAYWSTSKLSPLNAFRASVNWTDNLPQDPNKLLGKTFYLEGVAHAGRSSIANYCSIYARQNNWFVFHIPKFDLCCNGPWPIASSEEHSRSDSNGYLTPLFDQPLLAWRIFVDLLNLEGDRLKQIKLKSVYTNKEDKHVSPDRNINYFPDEEESYAYFESNPESTLFDLVTFGAVDRLQASRLFPSLISEIQNMTEFPVLAIIDGINGFEHSTGYFHPDNLKPLPAYHLTIPHHLEQKFIKEGIANGVTFACNTSAVLNNKKEVVKIAHKIPVPILPYTPNELQSVVLHYASNGFFHLPIIDRQFFGEVSLATNRIPLHVFKHCKLLGVE